MKKILFTIILSMIPGVAFAAPIGPVDTYMDLNGATIGSFVSTTTVNNGLIGGGGSSGISVCASIDDNGTIGASTTHMTVQKSLNNLMAPLIVGTTVYPLTHPSLSIALDNNFDFTTVKCFVTATSSISVGGFVTFGPPPSVISPQTFDYAFLGGTPAGTFAGMQLRSGSGKNYFVWIETGTPTVHSSTIVVQPGSTYWFTLKADWGAGVAQLELQTTDGNFIGYASTTMATGDVGNYFLFGNNETGSIAGTSTFQDLIIDTTHAQFPLSGFVPSRFSIANGVQLLIKKGINFIFP